MQATGKASGDIHNYFSSVGDALHRHIVLLTSAKVVDSAFFWSLYFYVCPNKGVCYVS